MTLKKASNTTGWIVIITGILISIFSFNPAPVISYLLIFGFLTTGVLARLVVKNSQAHAHSIKDFSMVSLISFVYAIVTLLLATDVLMFLYITSAFASVIGLHFLFSFNALDQFGQTRMDAAFYKVMSGLLVIIFAGFTLVTAFYNAQHALMVLGATKVLIGASFIQISKELIPVNQR